MTSTCLRSPRFGAIAITVATTGLPFAFAAPDGAEQPAAALPEVRIESSRTSQLGVADSANTGVVTQQQLDARTVYRPGELLEATPGLIVSQHSGEGKANQFYLRGFNLDHGTDLRTTVGGMLVNQRSHAHGQGWTDLNFLIPELATQLGYRKGPYYAAEGDFSSAGAVSIDYADRLDRGIASFGIGQFGYRRVLLADSPQFGNGHLLYALEAFHNDGPFQHPDDYRKLNGVLRYSEGNAANGFNVTGMAYHGKWNATDQIPRRAVAAGALSRFGAIDPTDGGAAGRYSLSGEWRRTTEGGQTRINAYIVRQRLDLFSNFTYFLDDPVNGDQFAQPDRRVTTGLNASHIWQTRGPGLGSEWTAGVQLQNDNIFNGLYSTAARQRVSTTRQDHIVESSIGVYLQNTTYWTAWLRSIAGLRADWFRFDVTSDNPLNSGVANDGIVSPKLGLVLGPWAKTEFYGNVGTGFHSNDARGTTIRVDPKTGEPADPGAAARALARRRSWAHAPNSSKDCKARCRFTCLDFDSELVFAGDAGTTYRGPAEPAHRLRVLELLACDALAHGRCRRRVRTRAVSQRLRPRPASRIPGAVEGVASVALAVDRRRPLVRRACNCATSARARCLRTTA